MGHLALHYREGDYERARLLLEDIGPPLPARQFGVRVAVAAAHLAEHGIPLVADRPGVGTPPGGGAVAPAGEPSAVAGFDRELGASVYGTNCASCHQADGRGLPGVFPPIAGDPVVTAEDPGEHITIVLGGLQGKEIGGVAYVSPMPAFGGLLDDEQVAAVINYQRTSFGNDAPLVSPEEVAARR